MGMLQRLFVLTTIVIGFCLCFLRSQISNLLRPVSTIWFVTYMLVCVRLLTLLHLLSIGDQLRQEMVTGGGNDAIEATVARNTKSIALLAQRGVQSDRQSTELVKGMAQGIRALREGVLPGAQGGQDELETPEALEDELADADDLYGAEGFQDELADADDLDGAEGFQDELPVEPGDEPTDEYADVGEKEDEELADLYSDLEDKGADDGYGSSEVAEEESVEGNSAEEESLNDESLDELEDALAGGPDSDKLEETEEREEEDEEEE